MGRGKKEIPKHELGVINQSGKEHWNDGTVAQQEQRTRRAPGRKNGDVNKTPVKYIGVGEIKKERKWAVRWHIYGKDYKNKTWNYNPETPWQRENLKQNTENHHTPTHLLSFGCISVFWSFKLPNTLWCSQLGLRETSVTLDDKPFITASIAETSHLCKLILYSISSLRSSPRATRPAILNPHYMLARAFSPL